MARSSTLFLSLAIGLSLLSGTSSAAPDRKATAKAGKSGKATRAKAAPRRSAPAPAITYDTRADAMAFADEVAARDGLDRAWVRQTIGDARFLANVPRLMLPGAPGRRKNWNAYRGRFIDATRIGAGVEFWRANAATLERAQREFGVPPEIIVGIIGVETIYGRNMGSFRVIDALATLSFDFPDAHPRADQRRAYFRGELETFLQQESRTHDDPLVPRGSYAGAMGMPQFMPSSIAKYAVDFDGDGRIDLVNNPADAIGSVASYFKGYGWTPGMPAIFPVRFDAQRLQMDALLASDIKPSFSADSFSAAGALLGPDAQQFPGLLALIELENGAEPSVYWAGTQNFYVITRYNWSAYYAMSVIDLGNEIKAALAQ